MDLLRMGGLEKLDTRPKLLVEALAVMLVFVACHERALHHDCNVEGNPPPGLHPGLYE